jgi:drug/metabolite transporter (DMT)-like permease
MSSIPRARTWVGVTLALAAAVAYALANASASLAYHSGSNPLTVAAIRFVLPTAVLVVWLLLRDVPLGLPTVANQRRHLDHVCRRNHGRFYRGAFGLGKQ